MAYEVKIKEQTAFPRKIGARDSTYCGSFLVALEWSTTKDGILKIGEGVAYLYASHTSSFDSLPLHKEPVQLEFNEDSCTISLSDSAEGESLSGQLDL